MTNLLIIGWRVYQTQNQPDLLPNSNFSSTDLTDWDVLQIGEGQVKAQFSLTDPNNKVLALLISNADNSNGAGIGQKVNISPFQRYQLKIKYQSSDNLPPSTNIIFKISQFNQHGDLIKTDELLNPDSVVTENWNLINYSFISDPQTASVELGIGFFGSEAALIEIDDFTLQHHPPPFYAVRYELLILLGLLLSWLGYQLGKFLWPFSWKRALINTSLVIASITLSLLALEIFVRFVPFRFLGPAWPAGYHISLANGQSYRIAKNQARSILSNDHGDQNVIVGNSLGLRDIEIPKTDNDQTIILVLGDSMTFGVVGDVEESWPRLLNTKLTQTSSGADNYHIVNAGVTGYNTFQEVMLFEELLQDMKQRNLTPKIVLLSFFSRIWGRNIYGPNGRFTVMNDVVMYSSVKQTVLNLPKRLIEQSQIDDLKLLRLDLINNAHQTTLNKSRLYFIGSLLLTLNFDDDWDARPNVDPVAINREALQLFKAVAEANNIQPIIGYFPGHYIFETEDHTQMSEFSALSNSLEIPFINPYENMKKLGVEAKNAREKLTLGYDSHYSVAGNKLYVDSFAPLLMEFLNQSQISSVKEEDKTP